ncbi:hypothetical protein KIL84_020150 [Mauremys mutica]|uniref:Uncharacterized protein n=1 Tax=Mauremys mutica TaxID=74926 RepID=A0A9D3XXT4_9SAUR|nr:hypothetical protein KIL84_020150 [Mauremys mutica]
MSLPHSPCPHRLPSAGIMAPVFSLCTSLPRQLLSPAQLRLPLLQDDVSSSQSGRAWAAQPAWRLASMRSAPPPLPPDSVLTAVRCGEVATAEVGEGKKEKNNTKPTKIAAAISRNRQNPSEQPNQAPYGERKRETETHTRVRQEKIPSDSAMATRRLITPSPHTRCLVTAAASASRSLHPDSFLPQQQFSTAPLCPR